MLAAKCEFLQTSPMSPFVQNLVVQRHMSNGLAILRGRTLRELTPTETRERVFEDVTDLMTTLTTVFGLDVPEVAGLWSKIVTRHDFIVAG
ncbi:arylamine N-acetyltransferase, partial [Streptomyces sp. P9(2023)]|uniref:arylamine N-acetyltransferase n=1 Tax=Streptomyces sp. P9(2023) TaxID=3064394 RepID=UPI0037DC049C